MKELIYLALGTNLGDREDNLQMARDSFPPAVKTLRQSPVYITPPWGYTDQPEFLNQVVEAETTLEPLPLLRYLKEIEEAMGRQATFRNGPRLIDLDILFYGRRIIEMETLHIPHPRLQARAFVLVPLNDLAPDFIHPVLRESVHALLSKVRVQGVRQL